MSDWSQVLEDDLSWREAELTSLKMVAMANSTIPVIHKSILRASWALLYAHFEGFTKFCWELVLDEIQKENVEIQDLKKEFQILAMEKEFKRLRGNSDSASLYDFYQTFSPGLMATTAVFPSDCRLDAESNLWPNVFEKECAKIGIRSKTLDEYRTRIKSLVARRNDIAHGESMTISSVHEYSPYEYATLLIMHELAVTVVEILENKSYLSHIDYHI